MTRILLLIVPAAIALGQARPELQLRGDRFPGLTYDQMTPAQKSLTDRALAARGTIGTFNILLRSPELLEVTRGTAGNRSRSELKPKHSELAIILNARYWTTQFEWLVHRQAANTAGLSTEITTAIAEGRRPTTLAADEAPIYDFIRELLKYQQVSDATFLAARNLVGEKGIVDAIGIVGFYQGTSMMMNADRYPMQPGQKQELKPLENTLPGGPMDFQALSAGTSVELPGKVQLRGDRFKPLAYDQMTPEQRTLADLVLSGRIQGGTGGPFNVLLRSPALGEAILRFGEYVRFRSPLSNRLNELATLIVTRYWTAQFPWYVHHRAALQAGLAEPVVAAIAQGRRPPSLDADEHAVYDFCTELLRTTQLSDATFGTAKDRLGERGLVELMGIMGYYGVVSMAVNTDRYPLPAGVQPELK